VTADQVEVDPFDARLALRSSGLLAEFNAAGVLSAADVHVASRLGRLGGESDERVLLAAALAVRAVRLGSVCVELARVRDTAAPDEESTVDVDLLSWPEPAAWQRAVQGSPLVAVGASGDPSRPLRLVEGLLYLDRYWRQEEVVRRELDDRLRRPELAVDGALLHAALNRLFPEPQSAGQRLAAQMAALRSVTVLAGGPGTGKTTTVAKLLDLLRTLQDGQGPLPRIALAAPTGKAAARLQEAVTDSAGREAPGSSVGIGDVKASTLHRLLGWKPGSHSRFKHDSGNRLPYDVVVVDECSMVSLTLMSRLLEAVRPDARLVLVGDPDQLASVEAGAVLGDLVHRPPLSGAAVPPGLAKATGTAVADGSRGDDDNNVNELRNGVVRLHHRFRFGNEISSLADAVRANEPDQALGLLRRGGEHVSFVESDDTDHARPAGAETLRDDVVDAARELYASASTGDAASALAALGSHRLLCAHRRGPYGVARWTTEIERWLAAADGVADPSQGEWYVGRPLLVTSNDPDVDLYNGDTGVVVDHPQRGALAAFSRGAGPVLVGPSRLPAVQTVHAMTIHKAQGSQFRCVTVLLPPPESPLLTRELFYTAVTRAEHHVRVIGSADSVRRAVSRAVVRASGLRKRR
jgi:exodeoxyribonuclease V alpha subunit